MIHRLSSRLSCLPRSAMAQCFGLPPAHKSVCGSRELLGNGRPVRFCRTGSRGEQEACFHRQRPRRGGFDYVVTAAQDLIRGTAYNAAVVPGVENTTMQQLQLVSFVLAMAALVVYGCI